MIKNCINCIHAQWDKAESEGGKPIMCEHEYTWGEDEGYIEKRKIVNPYNEDCADWEE